MNACRANPVSKRIKKRSNKRVVLEQEGVTREETPTRVHREIRKENNRQRKMWPSKYSSNHIKWFPFQYSQKTLNAFLHSINCAKEIIK